MKEAKKMMTTTQGEEEIHRIPEECVAKVICQTSPADACRAAAVSAAFRSAADSDAVWERFLPPDCDAILERAVHLMDFSSRKELFMDLSDEHVLLDDGKISFGLERSNGAKCYMLSVSQIEITWITVDLYWTARPDPDSRFSKVAELLAVCWLTIYGIINNKELSPSTHYAGYLVFKLTHDAYGLSSRRQISFVEVGGQLVGSVRTASLHPCNRASCVTGGEPSTMTSAAAQAHEHEEVEEGGVTVRVRYPRQRVDGWLEFEIGDFHTGDETAAAADIRMELHEVEEGQWKKGLILEGIEIKPKN